MSQRLHNLSKWTLLQDGRVLWFSKQKRRTVILDVNTAQEVAFYILQDTDLVRENPEKVADALAGRVRDTTTASEQVDGSGALLFLGLAKGRERFEFAVDGAFGLVANGGEAYVYSADGLLVASRVVDPLVFTRIANRRARNPELELMQYRMRQNTEARFRALEIEAERRVAAMEERLERYMPERASGTPIGDGLGGQRRPSVRAAARDDEASAAERPEVPAEPVAKPRRRVKAETDPDEPGSAERRD